MKAAVSSGGEFLEQDGVGDTLLMSSLTIKSELCEELGLCDEDEVVIVGEIFEDQAQTPQGCDIEQVGRRR